MTATESVSSDRNTIGAKKVSGLFFSGCVMKVITATPRMIYADAPRALITGFLVIELIYQIWLPLIDAFRNKEIEFGFSLQNIQTVFETFQLQPVFA